MPFGCEVAHINNKAPSKSTIEMVTHRRLKNRKSKHREQILYFYGQNRV